MLRWRKAAIDLEGAAPTLVLTMADAFYALEIDLYFRVWADYDLIERCAVMRNTGIEPIRLEQTLLGACGICR